MTTTTIPTVTEIEKMISAGTIRKSHTSRRRGYTSRRGSGYVEAYSGKFGTGFALISPCWDSSQYVYVTYYILA